jgi:hypothetical protein
MPSKKANLFDRVELYPYKTGKFLKYLKYQLKIKIKSNLAGRYLGKSQIKSQCEFHQQGTLSSYFLIVGIQPSALSSETSPI